MEKNLRRRRFLAATAAATTWSVLPALANVPKPYSWDLSPPTSRDRAMPLSPGCKKIAPGRTLEIPASSRWARFPGDGREPAILLTTVIAGRS